MRESVVVSFEIVTFLFWQFFGKHCFVFFKSSRETIWAAVAKNKKKWEKEREIWGRFWFGRKDKRALQVTWSFSIFSETTSKVVAATSITRRSRFSAERERGKFILHSELSCQSNHNLIRITSHCYYSRNHLLKSWKDQPLLWPYTGEHQSQ